MINFNAVIGACKKNGRWKQVLELLGEMHQCRLESDVISFDVAISDARRISSEWRRWSYQQYRLESKVASFNKKPQNPEICILFSVSRSAIRFCSVKTWSCAHSYFNSGSFFHLSCMEVGSRKRYLRPETPRLIGDITNGFTNIGPPRDTDASLVQRVWN